MNNDLINNILTLHERLLSIESKLDYLIEALSQSEEVDDSESVQIDFDGNEYISNRSLKDEL